MVVLSIHYKNKCRKNNIRIGYGYSTILVVYVAVCTWTYITCT